MNAMTDSKLVTAGGPRRPPAAGKGRVKGTPNKITKALKEMILGALDEAGGQDYLLEQSEKNPVAFMTLVGKVLPTTLANDPENPLMTMSEAELDAKLAAKFAAAGLTNG